jgi:hypothetical protein
MSGSCVGIAGGADEEAEDGSERPDARVRWKALRQPGTTPQMVLRFHQDVIALQPKVVVIHAETNDIVGKYRSCDAGANRRQSRRAGRNGHRQPHSRRAVFNPSRVRLPVAAGPHAGSRMRRRKPARELRQFVTRSPSASKDKPREFRQSLTLGYFVKFRRAVQADPELCGEQGRVSNSDGNRRLCCRCRDSIDFVYGCRVELV